MDEKISFTIDEKEMELDEATYKNFRPSIKKPDTKCLRFEAIINHNSDSCWLFKIHETYESTKVYYN